MLGSTVILVLKDQLQNWLPKLLDTNANFEMIVFGVLLILMLQYARNGLWPILANWWDGLTGADGSRRNLAPAPAPALPARQRPQSGQVVLEVDAIRKEFGGLVAVNDISFKVSSGEIMGLIGPNGAGKSTTFNLISGVCRSRAARSASWVSASTTARRARSPSWAWDAPSSTCSCCRA